ncbi:DMT family transporter [Motiliproteus sp. MSK22-1]|uniref:DMT family transporter n=1 Tax=Motiliproteus sp. MSK22-1 TaxID=1897630 RepID=UPI0009FA30F5|nr:EamA family transporter [Motiliproteus sp. MSK22-1]
MNESTLDSKDLINEEPGKKSLFDGYKPSTTVLGFLAASIIVFVWSGWIVVSKAGAVSAMTIYDIAALRFGVASIVALPIVLYYRPWKGMPLYRMLVLGSLAGVPYVLLSYAGFTYAPAAHGGVFLNGLLPAFTLLISWLWLSERPGYLQVIGSTVIVAGAWLVASSNNKLELSESWTGDMLFMLAGAVFSVYMLLNRRWNVSVLQVLLCTSLLNGLIYLPIWALLLPSNLAEAQMSHILLQGAYQGLLPTMVGLIMLSYAVRHIGAPATAAMMSAVPCLGAILGLLFLNENLGLNGWLGILLLTPGIIVIAICRKPVK